MLEIKINLKKDEDLFFLKEIEPFFNEYIYKKDKSIYIEKIKYNIIDSSKIIKKKIDSSKKSYNISNGYRIYKDYKSLNKVQKIKKNLSITKTLSKKDIEKINKVQKKFENKILTGDSLNLMKEINSNSIDLIFTSPPYNFGIDYNFYDDNKTWQNYEKYMNNIIKEAYRILKPGGRVVWNIQPLYSEYTPSHHIFYKLFLKNKFIWRNEIIWEKNNFTSRYTTWGSYMSPSSPYLKYSWEYILVFSKISIKKTKENEQQKSTISSDDFKKWVYGKWSIAPEKNMKKYGHDAMFPEELAKRVIHMFSYETDIVLDIFNGAGTTTKVAKDLNRRWIGFDLSKKYCNIANERLKNNK